MIQALNLRQSRRTYQQRTHPLIRRQLRAVRSARFYQSRQIATVVAPRMISIIVRDWSLDIDCLDERQVQLSSIYDPDMGTSLNRAIQKIPHYLVSDQQA